MTVTMTPRAVQHIGQQLNHRGHGEGIRVAVRTSGCSGMAYALEFADSIESDDQIFECDGVKLIIDNESLVYLQGTELDFVKEDLNEGFKFINPNVVAECGCGESFTVRDTNPTDNLTDKPITL